MSAELNVTEKFEAEIQGGFQNMYHKTERWEINQERQSHKHAAEESSVWTLRAAEKTKQGD